MYLGEDGPSPDPPSGREGLLSGHKKGVHTELLLRVGSVQAASFTGESSHTGFVYTSIKNLLLLSGEAASPEGHWIRGAFCLIQTDVGHFLSVLLEI